MKILSVVSVKPKHLYSTKEIIDAADRYWLQKQEPKNRSLALKIFHGAEISSRGSVIPLEQVFTHTSFQEKNDLYIEATKELAERALLTACEKIDLSPQKLDYLITTSCTGFMIPSVDAYLINKLNMHKNVIRMPITEMGCAGGTSAVIYAREILRGNPKAKIGIVCVEAPSLTFQQNDFSMENIVSTAIFADGAAAMILGEGIGPEIRATEMHHFSDSTYLMGYNLTNTGLKIVLDREVPDAIHKEFSQFFDPFLAKNDLGLRDINHFIFHPGGKKIIHLVESLLSPHGKNVNASKKVLSTRGNLSSATVFCVLEETIESCAPKSGDFGYMLAFGPGFSAQSILLRW
jgi:alkylresorcinol/alkylpyrone synthase